MPRSKIPRYNPPTYKTKLEALRHGHIQFGTTKSGARKFIVYHTKKGWSVTKKKGRHKK